ncbi:unnamed protein product, partial [Ectocarpus sp. 12 AP-2014]
VLSLEFSRQPVSSGCDAGEIPSQFSLSPFRDAPVAGIRSCGSLSPVDGALAVDCTSASLQWCFCCTPAWFRKIVIFSGVLAVCPAAWNSISRGSIPGEGDGGPSPGAGDVVRRRLPPSPRLTAALVPPPQPLSWPDRSVVTETP